MKKENLVRIGVVQFQLSNSIEGNLKRIIEFTRKAIKKKIEILCFPECALTSYITDFKKIDYDKIERVMSLLRKLARKEKINLIIGTPLKENKRIFNGAVVLLKNGNRLNYYKQHLTELDKKYFLTGKKNLVFKVGHIKCGIAICRDQNYPQIFENYQKSGIKILFLLAAHYYPGKEAKLKLAKNKALPIVRALDNKIYIAKSNAVGRVKNKISLGNSLIVSPQGFLLKEADQLEETILDFQLS